MFRLKNMLLKNDNGYAVPLVLMVMIVLALLGTALWHFGMAEHLQVSATEDRTRAYYHAKTAVEAVEAYILEEPDESDSRVQELIDKESTEITLTYDGHSEEIPVTVSVTREEDKPLLTIEADGIVDGKQSVAAGYLHRIPDIIAVGNSGEIIFFDGTNWYRPDSGISVNLNAIAWNGFSLVAVGQNGTIVVSDNGFRWSQVSSGTGSHLNGITWTGEYFVAVGENSTVIKSEDGYNWDHYNIGAISSGVPLRDVALGDGCLVIVGSDGNTGWIYTRQTGGSWLEAYKTPTNQGNNVQAEDDFASVRWSSAGNRFYVAGSGEYWRRILWWWDKNSHPQILTSGNGVSWNRTRLNDSDYHLNVVGCSPYKYIAVGDDGFGCHSDNGLSWEVETHNAITGNLNGITWHERSSSSTLNNDSFWVVGNDYPRLSYGYDIEADEDLVVYGIDIEGADSFEPLNDIISITPHQESAWR